MYSGSIAFKNLLCLAIHNQCPFLANSTIATSKAAAELNSPFLEDDDDEFVDAPTILDEEVQEYFEDASDG